MTTLIKKPDPDQLFIEIKGIIESAKQTLSIQVNSTLSLMYWQIGKLIAEEILAGERAEYGKKIIASLSQQLTQVYGKGFSYSALTRMARFADVFSDPEIVATLSQQLSWSHFLKLIPISDSLEREFYAQMCRVEKWSVRTLSKKIDAMLFQRSALSKKPEEVISAELETLRDTDKITPDLVFHDPYFLDFLGLRNRYLEKDLEEAIMSQLESFLLELGSGFSFIARQHRITIDNEDYYIDLLFFHRGLSRLVAIDLKLGKFKPGYKGQMELYLRWLDKHERKPLEKPPIGLILCAEKNREVVELLELEKSRIRVAEYYTDLPPREVLEEKLHAAVRHAQVMIENKAPEHKDRDDQAE